MFSRKEQIIQRTGKNGVGRYDFLKLLITEFQTSRSNDARGQVLANLANFAYDPVNYDYLRQLHVIDLFLNVLSDGNETLVRFAIGGICNLSLDPINREYILQNRGVPLASRLLDSKDEQTVLSAITALMFLVTTASKSSIVTQDNIRKLLALSNIPNRRMRNLALVFLTDYCTPDEVECVRRAMNSDSTTGIPLPL